ncbi:MAG: hypothetical protein HY795_02925 [Desulfovibrio sp.]|nr:hypothetical protein [Desulfovibrio sp.]
MSSIVQSFWAGEKHREFELAPWTAAAAWLFYAFVASALDPIQFVIKKTGCPTSFESAVLKAMTFVQGWPWLLLVLPILGSALDFVGFLEIRNRRRIGVGLVILVGFVELIAAGVVARAKADGAIFPPWSF